MSEIVVKHHQISTKTTNWYRRLRKHQASVSASLGFEPARWHMQNMQTSEFFHLLGHSSGSAGSGTFSEGDGTTR